MDIISNIAQGFIGLFTASEGGVGIKPLPAG